MGIWRSYYGIDEADRHALLGDMHYSEWRHGATSGMGAEVAQFYCLAVKSLTTIRLNKMTLQLCGHLSGRRGGTATATGD